MSTDWETVYRATYDDLVRFLHRKVWDADRARELAQEVFVRVLDKDPDDARALVFTVATNLARDEARSAIRRKRHLTLLKSESPTQVEIDPVERIEREQRMQRLREALEELSERDRDVLLLWDAGFDYPAIARETGLSTGAIGTTLARARRRLVEAYEALEARDAARG